VIERGDITLRRALEIASQIFDGLSAAHEAGVIHRDIKPDNVLIDRQGRVRILDFGLAKLQEATVITAEESTVGTAAYMSPEQARGAEVDARSDLFSAGVVLYEMVTGRRPFAGEHRAAALYAIVHEEPQPLGRYSSQAGCGLERMVAKLLAKEPQSRYPSAEGVLVDLRAEQGRSGKTGSTHPREASRRRVWVGGAIAVVALVSASGWWLRQRGRSVDLVTTGAPETPALAEGKSIAVLPFLNMSDDPSNEYFSDGISEELLNLLVKIPELRVVSRSSAFSFKGKDMEIPEIAERLHVAHILEGSVRKAGDRVRITAQLIEAGSDSHLWSETYDRTLDDIFAIQEEIAADVVAQLKGTLLGEAPEVEQTNAQAYALWLQARYLNSQSTAEGLETAIDVVGQALALDPNYAEAWAELARTYAIKVNKGLLPQDDGYRLARDAINKALSIDPELATAHASLGWIAMSYDADLGAAARHYEHALALVPSNTEVIGRAAVLCKNLGRLDEAITLQEYVVARDPVDPRGHGNLGNFYLSAGRLDEAIASYRTALALSPGIFAAQSLIGTALLLQGKHEAALAAMQLESLEVHRLIGLAMAYHALGQHVESDAALGDLIEKYEQDAAFNIAYVLAFQGEADRAFEWLDKAVTYNDPGLADIVNERLFANIHSDPRWLPFLRKVGKAPEKLAAIAFKVTLPYERFEEPRTESPSRRW
jgi:TolB-like protein/cytochrome c-type biogenesis protein CcmH/NrfG